MSRCSLEIITLAYPAAIVLAPPTQIHVSLIHGGRDETVGGWLHESGVHGMSGRNNRKEILGNNGFGLEVICIQHSLNSLLNNCFVGHTLEAFRCIILVDTPRVDNYT